MRRTSSRTAALALATAGALATVLVPPLAAAPPAEAVTTTTLLSVGFDGLARGSVSPSEFRGAFGGGPTRTDRYARTSVVGDTAAGDNAFRVTVPRGTVGPGSGFAEIVPLARPVDNACLSYNVRFDASFDWSRGGKLPGLSGVAPGVDPGLPAGGGDPGSKGWSSRIMWRTPESLSKTLASQASPDMVTQYLYGPDQVSAYGDLYPWYKKFAPGRWHAVKMCFTLNTVGRANGVMQTWLDGVAGYSTNSYVFRTRNDVRITHFMVSLFRGGSSSSWSGSRTDTIDIDDVKVTTTA